MSLPDRNNPYTFNPYLEWRKNVDYYEEDPFFQKLIRLYAGDEAEQLDREAKAFSKKVSFRWRDFSERIATPESRPYMMHYDGHKNRIDRIVRPYEIEVMEKEVFSEAWFADKTSDWTRFVKLYLLSQNSEAGVCCPLICTWGMASLLEKYADTPETKAVLNHVKNGIDGVHAIGAQFVSEIQGGSDVPANLLEAVEENGVWRIYGTKFFCSAAHADYSVITAKPKGSESVALFVIPMWLPGNKEKEIRNNYTIDRIKRKMGTVELPTAEITYNGTVAYPVGPLNRGVANVVGIVLTYSRLAISIGSAGGMARGLREVQKYGEFRTAFGLALKDFPMLVGQFLKNAHNVQRTLAGNFKVYKDFIALPGGLSVGLESGGLFVSDKSDEPLEMRRKRFDVRQLVLLEKITVAKDSGDMSRLAISALGGHGVMEDFSSLPRMLRDGLVNELWEGPRNVLLTQLFVDFQRARKWYPPEEFVKSLLKGTDKKLIREYTAELEGIMELPHFFEMNDKTIEACGRWDDFCDRLFHAYQDLALAEAEAAD
ncbi:MAG: acyl-CoA dehydrogenase family protein [Deltaproteobacteria bacterium]|nr:acyl-CoA dehydrogenase family protein [Deltaproteobacteria bacterium]